MVIQGLDTTINHILQGVRRLLPQEDIDRLSQLSSESGKDSLENDIQKLYRLLLTKNPNEVDYLIKQAFSKPQPIIVYMDSRSQRWRNS